MKRRDFIQRCLCATAGSAMMSSLPGKLGLAHAAALPTLRGNDYRALVCLFFYGGNDSFNMLVPRTGPARTDYETSRQALALSASSLHPLSPLNGTSDGSAYGLAEQMPQLAGLFNAGNSPLAIVSNLGERIERVARVSQPIALIFPDFGCPTGAVYKAFDGESGGAGFEERAERVRELVEESIGAGAIPTDAIFNDLASAACTADSEADVERVATLAALARKTLQHHRKESTA